MRIRKSIVLKAIMAFLVAVLISTGTVPSIVSAPEQAQAQTNWTVFDNPIYRPPSSWFGGTPDQQHGYTHDDNPGRYYNNSNYIYTNSRHGGRAEADWILSSGSLEGRYEIQAYIPSSGAHAAAKATYELLECRRVGTRQLSCAEVKVFPQITQAHYSGWTSLGEYTFSHKSGIEDVRLTLQYVNVSPYYGNSHVAVDAIRMRRAGGSEEAAPTAPRNVGAVAHGTRQIHVTWSPPSDSGSSAIQHYIVQYSRPAIGTSPSWTTRASTSGTSHTSQNLRYGVTYTVAVSAVNRDGKVSRAATDTATTRRRDVSETVVNEPSVTSLSARHYGDWKRNSLFLYWRPLPGISAYQLEWTIGSDNTNSRSVSNPPSSSVLDGYVFFEITNYRPGRSAEFRVRAQNAPWSQTHTVRIRDTVTDEIVQNMIELVRTSESYSVEASARMVSAVEESEVALAAIEDPDSYSSGSVVRHIKYASIDVGWSLRAAAKTVVYLDRIQNEASRARDRLSQIELANEANYLRVIESLIGKALDARDVAQVASTWAESSKATAELSCSANVVAKAGKIFDLILPLLKVIQIAQVLGSIGSIVAYFDEKISDGIEEFVPGSTAIMDLLDPLQATKGRMEELFKDLIYDALPPELHPLIDPFNPPDPRDLYDAGRVLAVCYHLDGVRIALPLCSDLSWTDRNILGKVCRKESPGGFTDDSVRRWEEEIESRSS